MQLVCGIENLPPLDAMAVTVGSFDGVHLGHRALLDLVKQQALRIGGRSVVMTFRPHPRQFFQGGMELLNTIEEKRILMDAAGIDYLVVLKFDQPFSGLSAEQFLSGHIATKAGKSVLVTGYNHHFGRNKSGDPDFLRQHAGKYGIGFCTLPKQLVGDSKVSSTVIRNLIKTDNIKEANRLLGYPYFSLEEESGNCETDSHGSVKLLPPSGLCHAKNVAVPQLESILRESFSPAVPALELKNFRQEIFPDGAKRPGAHLFI